MSSLKCLFLAPLLACAAATAVAADAPPKADPAFANPAFANPDTPGLMAGKPAPDVTNTVDVVFLKQMAIGNRAELELGKLANERSDVSGIDAFGDQMVRDHGTSGKDLSALARSAGVELPDALDAEHEAVRGELSKLRGADFDRRYLESQVKDHQKAAQLLIYEIGSGQHSGVREFASRTLPVVMGHLEHARALHGQLTGTTAATRTPAAAR
jgi:putative membrane protein